MIPSLTGLFYVFICLFVCLIGYCFSQRYRIIGWAARNTPNADRCAQHTEDTHAVPIQFWTFYISSIEVAVLSEPRTSLSFAQFVWSTTQITINSPTNDDINFWMICFRFLRVSKQAKALPKLLSLCFFIETIILLLAMRASVTEGEECRKNLL